MKVFEYQPLSVLLPKNFKRGYFLAGDIPSSPKDDPYYDYTNFFYDIFFSLDKKNIWAVGPPLYTLKEQILPFSVFYQGKKIKSEFFDNKLSVLLKIEAKNFKKNAKITLQGKNWSLNTKINSLPDVKISSLVLRTVQKNYSAKYIADWICWYYNLHQFETIFLYDNGSYNQKEVLRYLKKST